STARLAFATGEGLESLVRRAELLGASWDEAADAMAGEIERWERTPLILPADGYKSSSFSNSRMHPILKVRRPHRGLDVVARRGTPVVAAARGTVTYAGNTGGDYGYMVEIDHGDGLRTRYAHLARGSLVVKRGQGV